MRTEVLLGDEAVGLAAIDAGIAGAFSYPGTPATEIFEFISTRTAGTGRVFAAWSTNEKVAYEEALGMSYAGRRSIVSMKHVGLNVAADPFMSSSLTGVNGGLVLAVADDPGMHSSQNEQDSRCYAEFAHLPCFEPANQQECYDATREAFELSERVQLPVMIRLVTRLAHSRGDVRVAYESESQQRPRETGRIPDWREWTLLPTNARGRYQRLLQLQPKLVEESEHSCFNALTLAGPRGLIANGIAWNYVRESLGSQSDWSLLKIATYPPPINLIRRLVDHCSEVLMVEEGYPFIESRLSGLLGVPGKLIRGKLSGDVPASGEMTPDIVDAVIRRRPIRAVAHDDLPGRPPQFCQGCPHADQFKSLRNALSGLPQATVFGDIGCYSLGALPPHNCMHTCVDMGASISMAHGAAQAGVPHVVCTIGDSTFWHSGVQPLIGAIRSDADMTVLILDNSATAMTGCQDTAVPGDDLVEILLALGVSRDHLHVVDPSPKRHEENTDLLRREIAHRGLSVIVARRICIHVKRKGAATATSAAAS